MGKKVVHLCSSSSGWGFAIVYHLTGCDIGRYTIRASMSRDKLKAF